MSKSLSPKQIAEIRARADAANGGPWHWMEGPAHHKWLVDSCGDEILSAGAETDDVDVYGIDEDKAFIANARIDVPALCDHIDVLEAENYRLRAALDDVLTDLEERSNHKQGADKGVVDIGNGVYYRAKKALGVMETAA